MTLEYIRDYCLSKPGTSEALPFDENTLVFRVLEKMFLLTNLTNIELKLNLKCDPEYAIELREKHDDIIPGYHMSKKHWNTVYCEQGLDDKFILSLVDHSYDCVVAKMTKKMQKSLKDFE